MCGICGIITFNNQPVEESPLRLMMATMKHRGPDDEGIFIEENIGLGFVRLSILDLSMAGHQPMISNDHRYILVFNGEIYNYIEIRAELEKLGYSFDTKTDTEVLLNAYIEWGEACLDRFNGMWAFAIADKVSGSIFIARDRFGIKPFYYLHSETFFAFASEIPPLLKLLRGKPLPDYEAIFDYLVFNRTDHSDHTFFLSIKKLQHGHVFNISKTGIKKRQWYNLRNRVIKTNGFSDPDEFRELLVSSIGLRLRSDVPVGVCLSGGLDSSSIVSLLLKDYNKKDLHTFSAIYKKGQFGDETEFIREYASSLKNMHFVTPSADGLIDDLQSFVTAHAEPIPSTSPYAQYKVMQLASQNVVVTLDGQGADEELAGYMYFFGFHFKDLLTRGHLSQFTVEMIHYLRHHKNLTALITLVYFMLPERLRTYTKVSKTGYIRSDFIKTYKNSTSISSNLFGSKNLQDALINHFEYKLEHLLKWEDRNSMWFSLEARVPFLDYRLVEKTLATPSNKVISKGTTKYILRESMKGILPENIRLRQDKIGFGTPQDEWFSTIKWQHLIIDLINSTSFKERNLVDSMIANQQYSKHLKGKSNYSKEIWKWINLELWFRMFID